MNLFEKSCDFFTSQREQSLHEQDSCGVASLMMLLKHANVDPLPSWETLCHDLNLEKDPVHKGYDVKDPVVGLYPEDLFRYVIHKGYSFRMHFYPNEWQTALEKAPIMVMLDGILEAFPDDAHWVVLTQFDGQSFFYLDPYEKSQTTALKQLSFEKFQACYSGLACQLLNNA